MIAEHIEPECKEKKTKTIAIDRRFAELIYRLMRLSDGRHLLTITKSQTRLDLTVTELGGVEYIN